MHTDYLAHSPAAVMIQKMTIPLHLMAGALVDPYTATMQAKHAVHAAQDMQRARVSLCVCGGGGAGQHTIAGVKYHACCVRLKVNLHKSTPTLRCLRMRA